MKIVISFNANQKLRAYINNVSKEVGGFGSIVRYADYLYVEDVFLIRQTVTSATTDLTAKGLGEFYRDRIKSDPNYDMSKDKLWWHSHANMDVFWSTVDAATINDFDQLVDENNWMVSIVGNHKGELLGRVDVYSPVRVTQHNVPIEVVAYTAEFELIIRDEIKDKVTELTYVPLPNFQTSPLVDKYIPLKNLLEDGYGNVYDEEGLFLYNKKFDANDY